MAVYLGLENKLHLCNTMKQVNESQNFFNSARELTRLLLWVRGGVWQISPCTQTQPLLSISERHYSPERGLPVQGFHYRGMTTCRLSRELLHISSTHTPPLIHTEIHYDESGWHAQQDFQLPKGSHVSRDCLCPCYPKDSLKGLF